LQHDSPSRAPVPFLRDPKALVRYEQIKPYIGVSRTTWWKLVRAGKAPKPVRLDGIGGRAAFYVWGEIVAWRDGVINGKRAG
jgi:predicted DNA-binding transcriptional regulator AlpA